MLSRSFRENTRNDNPDITHLLEDSTSNLTSSLYPPLVIAIREDSRGGDGSPSNNEGVDGSHLNSKGGDGSPSNGEGVDGSLSREEEVNRDGSYSNSGGGDGSPSNGEDVDGSLSREEEEVMDHLRTVKGLMDHSRGRRR
ncbi:hypothetical protein BDN72DRAFT_858493 [Pluteus cervinus]|uniref:Uncharacterized protein n=1 Tax=Pluteus cervinus TaxID=181527 RepID=A0ACD3ARS6_9AGAR|nr:hypothetical protein BDN72DRAFT_858493 [Pluteus cervinus]